MANRTPKFDSIAYNKIQTLFNTLCERYIECLKPITCSTNIFNLSFNNSSSSKKKKKKASIIAKRKENNFKEKDKNINRYSRVSRHYKLQHKPAGN